MTQPQPGQQGQPQFQVTLQPEKVDPAPAQKQKAALESVRDLWVQAITEIWQEDWGITLPPTAGDLSQQAVADLFDNLASIGSPTDWAAEYTRLLAALGQEETDKQMALMTERQQSRLRQSRGEV